ncbi:MAG: hypothetical protein PF569_09845, partial [Candidatus Woesearchaeota archaeon]|nr:hypothetical protein [Candidatus Woesearchaeota archaeon]
FDNVNLLGPGSYGITEDYNHNTRNIFINSIISGHSIYGISLTSSGWDIYNNLFNNSQNIYLTVPTNLNTTYNSSKTNILDKTPLGGNIWTNPTGTGYSETCVDADVNNVCDTPYEAYTSRWDYLPIVWNGFFSLIINENITYIDPTPYNNSRFISNNITVKIDDLGSGLENVFIIVNSVDYPMIDEGSGIFSYNIIPSTLEDYTFQVHFEGIYLDERVFTIVPDLSETRFPAISILSLFISLGIILFGGRREK